MRVTFNTYGDNLVPELNRLGTTNAKLQNQISSGRRINRPGDEPAAAGRILNLQAESAQVQQFHRNAAGALDVNQSAYGVVDELRQVSDRVGEIAIYAVGPTTPVESLDPYATEVNELVERSLSSMNRQFNGSYIFGGTKSDAAPFVATRDAAGKITAVSYTGAASGASVQISNTATISPYTDGTTNQGFSDFLNHLITLRDGLANKDTAAVTAVRPSLTDSENLLLTSVGRLGAQQSRLLTAMDTESTRYDALGERISNENDVNLPEALVALTKSQTAYQAAIQSSAKIMSHSLLDYL